MRPAADQTAANFSQSSAPPFRPAAHPGCPARLLIPAAQPSFRISRCSREMIRFSSREM